MANHSNEDTEMTATVQTAGQNNESHIRKVTVHAVLPTTTIQASSLPIVSLKEVAWHDRAGDCWIVVFDRVYDLTNFLWEHPGGEEILLEYAGRDATLAFRGIGHDTGLLKAIASYTVGVLPVNEVIYCSQGKLL